MDIILSQAAGAYNLRFSLSVGKPLVKPERHNMAAACTCGEMAHQDSNLEPTGPESPSYWATFCDTGREPTASDLAQTTAAAVVYDVRSNTRVVGNSCSAFDGHTQTTPQAREGHTCSGRVTYRRGQAADCCDPGCKSLAELSSSANRSSEISTSSYGPGSLIFRVNPPAGSSRKFGPTNLQAGK